MDNVFNLGFFFIGLGAFFVGIGVLYGVSVWDKKKQGRLTRPDTTRNHHLTDTEASTWIRQSGG